MPETDAPKLLANTNDPSANFEGVIDEQTNLDAFVESEYRMPQLLEVELRRPCEPLPETGAAHDLMPQPSVPTLRTTAERDHMLDEYRLDFPALCSNAARPIIQPLDYSRITFATEKHIDSRALTGAQDNVTHTNCDISAHFANYDVTLSIPTLARRVPTKPINAAPTRHEENHPGDQQRLPPPRQSARRTTRHAPPSVPMRPVKPRPLPTPQSKNKEQPTKPAVQPTRMTAVMKRITSTTKRLPSIAAFPVLLATYTILLLSAAIQSMLESTRHTIDERVTHRRRQRLSVNVQDSLCRALIASLSNTLTFLPVVTILPVITLSVLALPLFPLFLSLLAILVSISQMLMAVPSKRLTKTLSSALQTTLRYLSTITPLDLSELSVLSALIKPLSQQTDPRQLRSTRHNTGIVGAATLSLLILFPEAFFSDCLQALFAIHVISTFLNVNTMATTLTQTLATPHALPPNLHTPLQYTPRWSRLRRHTPFPIESTTATTSHGLLPNLQNIWGKSWTIRVPRPSRYTPRLSGGAPTWKCPDPCNNLNAGTTCLSCSRTLSDVLQPSATLNVGATVTPNAAPKDPVEPNPDLHETAAELTSSLEATYRKLGWNMLSSASTTPTSLPSIPSDTSLPSASKPKAARELNLVHDTSQPNTTEDTHVPQLEESKQPPRANFLNLASGETFSATNQATRGEQMTSHPTCTSIFSKPPSVEADGEDANSAIDLTLTSATRSSSRSRSNRSPIRRSKSPRYNKRPRKDCSPLACSFPLEVCNHLPTFLTVTPHLNDAVHLQMRHLHQGNTPTSASLHRKQLYTLHR